MTSASGVYAIIHRESGKLYIGSAVNITGRWHRHRLDLSRNRHHSRHLQRAWNKHGEDAFAFVVVRFCPVADLISEEQRWLDETDAAGRHGYNSCPTAGSCLGVKRTPEACANIAASQKGRKRTPETRAKISAAQKGRKWTPEHIANNVAAHKGRKRTPEVRAKIAAAKLGRKHTPETRAKMAVAKKGRKQSPEHVAKATSARAEARKAAKLARAAMVQGQLFL